MQDHTRKELHKHLVECDVNGVNKLIASGDIEGPDQMIELYDDGEEWTLLTWACDTYKNHNDISLITALVKKHNANVNAQGAHGYTAVHHAIACGLDRVLRFLVEEGRPNLELRLINGATALHLACGEDTSNEDIVKCLLDYHADVNAADAHGWTPLHYAALYNKCSIARLLLADDRVNMEAIDEDGDTPLCGACFYGNAEIVKVLLSNGANPDADGHRFGWTPLIHAVQSDSTSCIQALIKAKVDLNKGDSGDQTALHHAVIEGNVDVAELLLIAKADWSAKDDDGHMPADVVKEEHREPVETLFMETLIGMVQQYQAFHDTVLRGSTQGKGLLKTLEPDVVLHIAGYCDVPTGDELEKIRLEVERLRSVRRGRKRKHSVDDSIET